MRRRREKPLVPDALHRSVPTLAGAETTATSRSPPEAGHQDDRRAVVRPCDRGGQRLSVDRKLQVPDRCPGAHAPQRRRTFSPTPAEPGAASSPGFMSGRGARGREPSAGRAGWSGLDMRVTRSRRSAGQPACRAGFHDRADAHRPAALDNPMRNATLPRVLGSVFACRNILRRQGLHGLERRRRAAKRRGGSWGSN